MVVLRVHAPLLRGAKAPVVGSRRVVQAFASDSLGLSISEKKGELLSRLRAGGVVDGDIERLVGELEAEQLLKDTSSSPLLPGAYKLLCSYKPGAAAASITSFESWRKYLLSDGPSPLQSLATSSARQSSSDSDSGVDIIQLLELEAGVGGGGKFCNIVDFGERTGLLLNIVAEVERDRDDLSSTKRRVYFRFCEGEFILKNSPLPLLPSPLRLPYPVPFKLISQVIPDETLGYLETTYIDESLRVSKGNRGTVFILERIMDDARVTALSEAIATL